MAVAHQAPLSMGFSRQESWSGLPCPSSGDLPYLGVEPRVPTLHPGLPHCRQILYHYATWEAPFQPCFRIKIRVLTLRKRLLLSCPIFFPTSHFFSILRWMIWLYSFSLSLFFIFKKKFNWNNHLRYLHSVGRVCNFLGSVLHNRGLEQWTSVTALLQLRVVFSKRRIVHH